MHLEQTYASSLQFSLVYSKYTPYYQIVLQPKDSSQSLTADDFDAYKAKLLAAGWTQDPAVSSGNRFIASDGKTMITLSQSSYSGNITIKFTYTA